jgi:hypothetical protein
VGGTEPTNWTWSGDAYQALDQVISGDTATQEQGDATAQ